MLLEITMYFFSISIILGKIIVAKDDVENLSIKNNVISNPKGKLIFTWKVFTLTNTEIMSKLALLRLRQLSLAAPRWAPVSRGSLSALTSDSESVDLDRRSSLHTIRNNLLYY